MRGGALTDEKRKFIIQCAIGNNDVTDHDTKSVYKGLILMN